MGIWQRIGGGAAIAGGALRIANAFMTAPSPKMLTMLYLVTDVFLLAGIAGLWLQRRATLGVAGTIGIAVFVIGILAIRASAFGIGSYQLGATGALLGLMLYSLETLIARRAAVWAPLMWLLSLAAGVAAAAGFHAEGTTALAGVAFGLGFIVAGAEMLRR